jgi:hypothetical protein
LFLQNMGAYLQWCLPEDHNMKNAYSF